MPTVIPDDMLALLNDTLAPLKTDAEDAFERILSKTYIKMAEDIRDERDNIIEAIEEGDRYRGREVVKMLDDAIHSIIGVVEKNLPSTTEGPGLTTIYYEMINS